MVSRRKWYGLKGNFNIEECDFNIVTQYYAILLRIRGSVVPKTTKTTKSHRSNIRICSPQYGNSERRWVLGGFEWIFYLWRPQELVLFFFLPIRVPPVLCSFDIIIFLYTTVAGNFHLNFAVPLKMERMNTIEHAIYHSVFAPYRSRNRSSVPGEFKMFFGSRNYPKNIGR